MKSTCNFCTRIIIKPTFLVLNVMGNHNLDEFNIQMDEQAAKSKYFVALDVADILERDGLSQYQQQRINPKLYGHKCVTMIKLVVNMMLCFLMFNNCIILHFIYKPLFFLFFYAVCLHLWFIDFSFYVHFNYHQAISKYKFNLLLCTVVFISTTFWL